MISVQGLGYRYRRDTEPVLTGIDRDFPAGSVTVVTGPSGSGKSTMLYLLGLMLTPTVGSVIVNGTDTRRMSDAARTRLRAAHIGFVFQDAALDATRSVLDNVVEGGLYAGMSRRSSVQAAHQLLERFGVGLRASHRPGEVSGGQAQRVGMCRALLKNPSVVLADEPTGNLDPTSAGLVLDALSAAAGRGATVVISSHDAAVAQRADHVVAFS